MYFKRLAPHRPFPPYAFIPGQSPHPEKEGGHMYEQEIEVKDLVPSAYQNNEDYLYAVDLYNAGYFWESHVWWEALWHKAGRKGELADFLKALIKLAAAGVKAQLKHNDPAIVHAQRALELLGVIAKTKNSYCGIKLDFLSTMIEQAIEKESFQLLLEVNLS